MTRYRNKLVQRIPGGEVQYGLLSHRIIVWFRGRVYVVSPCIAGSREEGGE